MSMMCQHSEGGMETCPLDGSFREFNDSWQEYSYSCYEHYNTMDDNKEAFEFYWREKLKEIK